MAVYDLVIRDARLVDGTGVPAIAATVAVANGQIAGVFRPEEDSALRGSEEVDGAGRVLCPGFVDVHAHDDFAALIEPLLPFKTTQGVTTEVVGNCGIGAAPFPGAEDWFEKLHPGHPVPSFQDFGGYFSALNNDPPAVNVAVLAGHCALRRSVAPHARGPLSRRQLVELERAVDGALDAGVIGMSAGLIYEPGVFSDTKELIALAKRLSPRAPLFTVHLRSEADELLLAVREALEVAREAGVGLQLSHHKAHGRNNWGKVRESLALVDEARRAGMDAWVDLYPYTAGSTILKAVLDRGGLQGGPALGVLLPSDIVVASCPAVPDYEGLDLSQIAARLGSTSEHAGEEILRQEPGTWVVVHAMDPADVETVMKHPHSLFGSDGLPTSGGRPHPRLWGTFPRILGTYVRERGVLSLETAIAKMTGLAAARFGLADRGVVRPGAAADLVLFNEESIDAGSSYDDPVRRPLGIERVWVNGVLTVRDGETTGKRAGRVLRRAS